MLEREGGRERETEGLAKTCFAKLAFQFAGKPQRIRDQAKICPKNCFLHKKTLILKMAVVDVEIEICKTGNLKSAVD